MKNYYMPVLAFVLTAVMLPALMSCGESRNGWTINGVIEGAGDSVLYVEEPSGAAWVILDSVRTDNGGAFSYTALRPGYGAQNIYRLRLGDRAVYFPADNTEALTLTARNTDMDKVHRLSGSAAAEGFNTVDSLVNAAVERVGARQALNDEALISSLADVILGDTTCIVGYYAVMHPIEDRLIFTPDNRVKLGLIGAVATRYKTLRPNDVRGQQLEAVYNNARKSNRGASMTASVSGRPELEFVREDENGNMVDLDEVLDRGGVTVVNLIRYDDPKAPANTAALGEAYEKYKERGLEIFQIGFDANKAYWRQNAGSMPWITVYSDPRTSAPIMMAYNANPVDGAPVSLVFNRNGELVKRVSGPDELGQALANMF